MKLKSVVYTLTILSILANILSCKEINVKTAGQTQSEQQITYIEKRLELVEKRVTQSYNIK